jgi:hypothetical protein
MLLKLFRIYISIYDYIQLSLDNNCRRVLNLINHLSSLNMRTVVQDFTG